MLQVIWIFITILLYVTFLFVCFRATKYVKENLGLLASIVFVLGLLSFISHANFEGENRNKDGNGYKKWYFQSSYNPNEPGTEFKVVTLEKISINEYQLGILYRKDSVTGEKVPVAAWSWVEGLVSGIYWNPTYISADTSLGDKKKRFIVQGSISWKLLGFEVYNQTKNYNIAVDLP